MLLESHLIPSWKSLMMVSAYAHCFLYLSLFIRGSKLPGTVEMEALGIEALGATLNQWGIGDGGQKSSMCLF